MAGQNAPSELFPDVVNARLRMDFNLVRCFGLHSTNHLPSRNDEGVVAAGTDVVQLWRGRLVV